MRTEQIIAKALKVTGGDRYKLSLMTSKRTEELAAGATPLVENIDTRNMKFADIAILELAEGKITLDGIIDKD
ncbi:MAG: DNA-directed RNA polymerase subunit omega [Campylobacter sp.]|nr:DNA-directed RNA polymerase subunit omega [Campylobacter sp.]